MRDSETRHVTQRGARGGWGEAGARTRSATSLARPPERGGGALTRGARRHVVRAVVGVGRRGGAFADCGLRFAGRAAAPDGTPLAARRSAHARPRRGARSGPFQTRRAGTYMFAGSPGELVWTNARDRTAPASALSRDYRGATRTPDN